VVPTGNLRPVLIDPALAAEARALGINPAGMAEGALRAAIRDARRRKNAAALVAYNEWAAENGMPLAEYRPACCRNTTSVAGGAMRGCGSMGRPTFWTLPEHA
jgi:post-segregation antitoxin (ccd killing protein)